MSNDHGSINGLARDDLISRVNFEYNDDASRDYKDYRKELERLSDDTLRSILRTVTASEGREKVFLTLQFSRRGRQTSENMDRFAQLMEKEYFSVRNELLTKYNNKPTIMGTASAVGGVLAFEDTNRRLSDNQRHHAILILASQRELEGLISLNPFGKEYSAHTWIDDDVFNEYVTRENSEDYQHALLTAIYLGHRYSRFLEYLESIDGTIASKPLVTGIL